MPIYLNLSEQELASRIKKDFVVLEKKRLFLITTRILAKKNV
jgi:hypothetical protein